MHCVPIVTFFGAGQWPVKGTPYSLHFHSGVCVCNPTAVITLLCHQLPIITPGSIGSIQLWKPTQSPPNIHPVTEEVSGVHSLFYTHSHTYNVYTPITILYTDKRGCVYLIFQNVASGDFACYGWEGLRIKAVFLSPALTLKHLLFTYTNNIWLDNQTHIYLHFWQTLPSKAASTFKLYPYVFFLGIKSMTLALLMSFCT